jgi:hypothetical protein
VTLTVEDAATAGIEEILRLLPFTVKQPTAGPDAHGSRTTGVPACCWLVVPISIAVAPETLLPETVTAPPPEMLPETGLTVTPDGAVGSVPPVAELASPGMPSAEDAVTVELDWIVDEVTPNAVTIPSTVSGGRDVPAANGVELSVQVMTCPDGAEQVQPDPYAPTGVTPAGSVSLTDTGELSLAPEAETDGLTVYVTGAPSAGNAAL